MLRRRPMVSKTYDFETNDKLYFCKFLDVMGLYDVMPLDMYEGATYDVHWIRFCCDKQTRLKIEYIFRRLSGINSRYLLALDDYRNMAERFMEENYAIY